MRPLSYLRRILRIWRRWAIPLQFRVPTHEIPERRLLYVEIPKTGCASIKYALLRFRPACRDVLGTPAFHTRFGYTHLDYCRLRETLQTTYKGWRIFTVVRNPYARFLSYYMLNYMNGARHLRQQPLQIDQYLDALLAGERVAIVGGKRVTMADTHIRPQHLIIGSDLSPYEFIGRTEDMAAVFAYLDTVVGEPVPRHHKNNSRHLHTGPYPVLTDEQKAKIYALYEEDFVLLGYEK